MVEPVIVPDAGVARNKTDGAPTATSASVQANGVARLQRRPKSPEACRPASDAVWFTRAQSGLIACATKLQRCGAQHGSRAAQTQVSALEILPAIAVPDLTSFSGVQLNARVLLPICKDNRMISIRQPTFEKSAVAARAKMRVKEFSNSRIGNSVKNTERAYLPVSGS